MTKAEELFILLTSEIPNVKDGKMFGAVTTGMIADQLKTQFDVTLDKRKIHFPQPIRALGEHEVELRLHTDVTTTLKVRVESSTPVAPPPIAPAGEHKRDDYRTEKRGKRPEPAADKADSAESKPRSARTEKSGRVERPVRSEKGPKAEKAGDTGKSHSPK